MGQLNENNNLRVHYKTIVISDVHLGTAGSKVKELVSFLKLHACDTLLLNGDIIDGWQLKKYGTWRKKHTRFIKAVIKMIEQYDTKVVYTRGNHDDFLDQILPMRLGSNLLIQREYIYHSRGKRYLVTHGDVFDTITSNLKWIAQIGDIGYTLLLWINKVYNRYRVRKGLPYYSLSQKIKQKVKTAVSYISDYEAQLANLAKSRDCQGVICGHIHQPAIKMFGDIQYLNSGDWVESMSVLVEDYSGEWSILYYNLTTDEVEDDDNGPDENLFESVGAMNLKAFMGNR